jgi:hypothetical protein
MRRTALLVSVLFAGCDSDVIIGRYLNGPDGGGASTDGGASDGGADDGGQPDLTLRFTGPFVIQQGTTETWQHEVRNTEGGSALSVMVAVTLPSGVSVVSGCGAVDGGARCDAGTIGPVSVLAVPALYTTDAGVGWRTVTGAVSTPTAELNASNNTATFPIAVTGAGATPVPITGTRQLNLSACFGSNITSYAQCTAGSLVQGSMLLLDDAGVDTLGQGYAGFWGQSPHQRNLAFRFLNLVTGNTEFSYAGSAVDAGCFEGLIDVPPDSGTISSGAWQGCLQ